jgi:hypothetical protein
MFGTFIYRSRSHIQRCNGEADLTPTLISNQAEEDGCSLESGDIDETESIQLETVSSLYSHVWISILIKFSLSLSILR